MKNKDILFKKTIKANVLMLAFLTFMGTSIMNAQSVFDANFNNISFLAANQTFKVGTDGKSAGDKTLYTNVITIGGQPIDCIVTTVIYNGRYF